MAEAKENRPDREAMTQRQLERLQTTLNRAYRNVPFHRNRQNSIARKTGRDPSVMEQLSDIAALPFMERRDLGEHYPYGLFAVPLKDIVRIHTASGTSDNPTVTGYTRQDLVVWQSVVAEALTASGVTSRDILQISLDPGLANWGRDYKDGAESLSVGVIPNTPLSPEKQLMVLRDYRSSVLVTTPSAAAQLATHLFRSGLNPTALNLRRVILVGEPLEQSFREMLADQLHAENWLHFGLSEVPGPAIAFECEAREGLHINGDHFLPEIIDPETGEMLDAGKPGELVLTTLTARAFPLIRFRTGERARLLPEHCSCGRILPRMEWLSPRTDALLNVNGVKIDRNQIERRIEMVLGVIPPWRHVVRRDAGEKNRLEVWLGVTEDFFSDEIRGLEERIRTLSTTLHEHIGVPVAVRLREATDL